MADKGSDFNWLRNQWVNELPKELKAAIAAGDNAWQQDVQMRQYTVRGRSGHRFSEFMHGANRASPEPTGLRPALPITPLMRQPTPKLPRVRISTPDRTRSLDEDLDILGMPRFSSVRFTAFFHEPRTEPWFGSAKIPEPEPEPWFSSQGFSSGSNLVQTSSEPIIF